MFKKVTVIFANLILVFLLAVGVIILVSFLPLKHNFKILTVTSGSMEPTLGVGSAVVVRGADDYRPDQIITFRAPEAKAEKDYVTHRIVSLEEHSDGRYYVTRGDANDAPDSAPIAASAVVGRVLFDVPYIGYVLSYIKTLPGLLILVVVPATIIVYEEVKKIRDEGRAVLARRRARRQALSLGREKAEGSKSAGTSSKKKLNETAKTTKKILTVGEKRTGSKRKR